MSQTHEITPINPSLTAQEQLVKRNAIIGYALLLAGLFTGIFWLAGGIWASIKCADAKEGIFKDHYLNIITIFWWGLGLSILGMITAFFIVGYLIISLTVTWSIYRIVKGLAKITSNRAYLT